MAIQAAKDSNLWKFGVVFGLLLFLGIQIAFVFLGRVNADEGWYLYASQLVYAGQRPYQDFAFTQTPFLPYVYGLPQLLFSGGLYVGRATSVVLSGMALVLSLGVARRFGGWRASGITALLWATFSFGLYFQTITKTYALTTFLLALTLFAVTAPGNQRRYLILATVFGVLASLTRLSAVLFALPVVWYCFRRVDRRGKLVMGGIIMAAVLWVAFLSWPNVEAAQWNLITHHAAQWGDLSLTERLVVIFRDRSEALFLVYPSYFLLLLGLLLFGFRLMVAYLKGKAVLVVTTIGLLLFTLPNLASGGFHAEYFVPFVFMIFPVAGILFGEVSGQVGRYSKIGLYLILLLALGLALFRGGWAFVDRTGGRLPVEEIREVADFVAANSTVDDRVYALEGLWVVVEADRQTLPNMTLAQFSFFRGPTEQARSLHLVSEEMTLAYITAGLPKIIIMTDIDWRIFRNSQNSEALEAALAEGYGLGLERAEWGQFHGGVQVYVRHNNNPSR